MGWKLKRLKQCAKCPWKVSTDPHEIPHGYSIKLHRGLAGTIASQDVLPDLSAPLRVMGCHEHEPGAEAHCVGWLMNQLGPGNNIGDVQLDGPQHERFEDTLPEGEQC